MKKNEKLKKVLIIVTHPDGETIWIGGMLLKNKDKWKTTIVSLCRKDDKDREPKFKQACREFNAKCFISDLDDSETGNYKEITNEDIIKRITQFIKDKNNSYDYIFTHGKNGEYGHIRHIEVHNAVNEMLDKKLLNAKKVFFFSYNKEKSGESEICVAEKNADKFIKLKSDYLNKKKQIIKKIYGFDKQSFEYKCCNDEAFDIKK